jgi:ribonuclease Z
MEHLSIAGLTLAGVAQGGCQTAIHIPEAYAIFDAGRALSANVEHLFITHGHPDHIGALPAIVAKRTTRKSEGRPLQIHLPEGIAANVSAALTAMDSVFGDRVRDTWIVRGHAPGDVIPTGKDVAVRALRTFHGVASCGWAVEQTVRRLKPDFLNLDGSQIAALRRSGVDVTDVVTNTVAVIPGDTMVDFLVREPAAQKAKVLLHEVTFWDDRSSVEGCRRFGHTHVDEMIAHCEKFEGEALVLVHRSLKHRRSEVEEILHRRFPAAMLPKIHLFDGGDR